MFADLFHADKGQVAVRGSNMRHGERRSNSFLQRLIRNGIKLLLIVALIKLDYRLGVEVFGQAPSEWLVRRTDIAVHIMVAWILGRY